MRSARQRRTKRTSPGCRYDRYVIDRGAPAAVARAGLLPGLTWDSPATISLVNPRRDLSRELSLLSFFSPCSATSFARPASLHPRPSPSLAPPLSLSVCVCVSLSLSLHLVLLLVLLALSESVSERESVWERERGVGVGGGRGRGRKEEEW